MIESKKLKKFKNIKHGFFNSLGGVSSEQYKSLNCGIGSKDKKINVSKDFINDLNQIKINDISPLEGLNILNELIKKYTN